MLQKSPTGHPAVWEQHTVLAATLDELERRPVLRIVPFKQLAGDNGMLTWGPIDIHLCAFFASIGSLRNETDSVSAHHYAFNIVGTSPMTSAAVAPGIDSPA